MATTLALFGTIGNWELLIIAALGLLIFGKRLPEVGRSLGKGIVEFKKGLSGIEDEVKNATDTSKPSNTDNKPSGHLNADASQQSASTQNESTKTPS